jgi:hypothetical protein
MKSAHSSLKLGISSKTTNSIILALYNYICTEKSQESHIMIDYGFHKVFLAKISQISNNQHSRLALDCLLVMVTNLEPESV